MSTFLLCWYALGWVSMGAGFTLVPKSIRHPGILNFIIPPFIIIAMIIVALMTNSNFQIRRSTQYLWRKL